MNTKLLDTLLALLLPAVVLLHLALAPDTKVEESFNLQAAHDVLVYGTPTGPGAAARLAARYDHAAFPGAVPRTFVGAVVLAGIGQAVLAVAELGGRLLVGAPAAAALFFSNPSGPACQAILRGILGLANAAALVVLGRAMARRRRPAAARWFYIMQAAQFHVVFYASRTLPNAFAFFLTTLAWAFLVASSSSSSPGSVRVALALLTFAAVVFRAEVALLLAAVAAHLLAVPLASLQQIVRTVAVAGVAALVLSVPIDTYFWQANPSFSFSSSLPLWPELHAFVFNVWNGQASQWGTLPWHWYATAALPRLLLNPALWLVGLPAAFFLGNGPVAGQPPAIAAAAITAPTTRALAARLTVPSLLFVALYSLQPHKEARFVLYVVPALTAAAALGADELLAACWGEKAEERTEKKKEKGEENKTEEKRQKTLRLLPAAATAVLALSIPLAFAASTAMLLVSALNYPGGDALAVLRGLVRADEAAGRFSSSDTATTTTPPQPWTVVAAHVDVLACMTGVTLFGSTLGPAVPSLADAVAQRDAAAAAVTAWRRGGGDGHHGAYDAWADNRVVVAAMGGGEGNRSEVASAENAAAPPPLFLVVDKTEQAWALRDPAFWAQFDYVLAEDPDRVGGDDGPAGFEAVAVVHGYAGVEVLRPGDKEEEDSVAVPVAGRGAVLARVRRAVRVRTGGWWVGPRTTPRIYVLRRVRAAEAAEAVADHEGIGSGSGSGVTA